ncbi:hypothetical protein CEXT_540741 [Caerostris extrusa]|uniref:Uncharacterized protein n=1 Tax=Caerostris extrusa TaxID=172846 RepID=A0AAV4XPI4_CAEEX|nr:hypothetical protein CEXT_540741 [Caerostris extrusa]
MIARNTIIYVGVEIGEDGCSEQKICVAEAKLCTHVIAKREWCANDSGRYVVAIPASPVFLKRTGRRRFADLALKFLLIPKKYSEFGEFDRVRCRVLEKSDLLEGFGFVLCDEIVICQCVCEVFLFRITILESRSVNL